MLSRARLLLLPLAPLAVLPLASCGALVDAPSSSAAATDGASGGGADAAVAVNATDSACEVAETDLPGGVTTFSITNAGSQVTEVYVYDGDATPFSSFFDLPKGSRPAARRGPAASEDQSS